MFFNLQRARAKLGAFAVAIGAVCPLADAADCAAIDDDLLRLACYDKNAGRNVERKAAPAASADLAGKPSASSVAVDTASRNVGVIVDRRAETDSKRRRTLADSWDLDPANGRPPFE